MPRTATRPAIRPALSFSDQLRSILQEAGSAYSIARAADIDPGQVLRFLSGERGLNSSSIDKLAAALGLRIIAVARPKGRPRAARTTRPTDGEAAG